MITAVADAIAAQSAKIFRQLDQAQGGTAQGGTAQATRVERAG
jgi:hypothetical protein